jgi:hypothetical protein
MNEMVILCASLGIPALILAGIFIYTQVQAKRPRRKY